MVDEERIKELEAIDRRHNINKRLSVIFFAVLSVVLVVYAVNIERKIQRLSESPAVVVYKNSSEVTTDDTTEDNIDNVPSDQAVIEPVSEETVTTQPAFNEKEDNTAHSDKAENVKDESSVTVNNTTVSSTEKETHKTDSGQVYYVTASGKKYHKSGCSYLTSSKREINADEILSGGYTPCSRCFKK